MIKRIGIYIINDNDGIWDRYIYYYLNNMMHYVEKIIIFYRSEPEEYTIKELYKILPEDKVSIYLHTNDSVGKIVEKAALMCDQLILTDDSIFGPFYDLEEVFLEMEHKKYDFWGISQQSTSLDLDGNLIKPYIKPYFIAVSGRLLKSKEFHDYLEHYDVLKKDGSFTRTMEQYGYSWGTYCNASGYVSDKPGYNIDLDKFACYEMIKKFKNPFLLCENFEELGGLENGFRESLQKAFRYIDQETEYNVDLIWEHILRVYNIADIQECLHLNYVIPSEQYYNSQRIKKKTVLIFHMYYKDLLDENLDYISRIPEEIDIIITTKDKEQKEYIESRIRNDGIKNIVILLAGKRGRDAGALLVACKDYIMQYEYLCFVHDKKTTGGNGPATVGEAFRRLIYDNLIISREYIRNIVTILDSNPRLGLLAPPLPAIGGYITELIGNEWTCCFETTVELAKELGLKVQIEKQKTPFALSTAFWCRTNALRPLFEKNWSYDDFPEEPLASDGTINHAIERILIYVAQNEGYYSGIVQSDSYAALYVSNIVSIISKLISDMRDTFEVVSVFNFKEYYKGIFELNKFCLKHDVIMLYGAGNIADHITRLFETLGLSFECYLVSDKTSNPDSKNGYPVRILGEIINREDKPGIILALNNQNQAEVRPLIESLGFDYYCLP